MVLTPLPLLILVFLKFISTAKIKEENYACVLEENKIKFGFIPLSYIIYVSALIIQNSVLAANDKAVLALGNLTRWWVIVSVLLFTIFLEFLFEFYSKKLEGN